ncbi:hypothetical protein [Paenibacillus ehimensis]|uniref:hypothetical protein n=1 Tax=Paenibacillus ehimensis TaxID=79264 RepID=UPI00046E68EE|nr:hypothetical protein [Paenibacillus ehimensis]
MMKVIEDFIIWLVSHWKEISLQAALTSLAVIWTKRVGIKQVKKYLTQVAPKYFKDEDNMVELLKTQSEIIKELHFQVNSLEKESEVTRKYVEGKIREIHMKMKSS